MDRHVIKRLGHRGDGVSESGVFVSGALPGEVVEGVVQAGRMDAPRILTPSSDRVRPPCRHAKTCGGCVVQHAADDLVVSWKTDVMVAAMTAQGLPAPVRDVHISPPSSRRRASLSGQRTRSGAMVGFHARASDAIVAVPDCKVLVPEIIGGVPLFEELTTLGASRKGRVKLAVLHTAAGLDIALAAAKPLTPEIYQRAATAIATHDAARLTWNGELVAERRPPRLAMGQATVVPPPAAFLQATQQGEDALVRAVEEATRGARRIADLFSGMGTFTLPLAARAEVHAVEAEDDLLAALDAGWRRADGLKKVTTERRDLFRRPLEGDELHQFDAVVVDPPRAGAEAQALRLATDGPPHLAMVSCNPITFARDCRILAGGGYSLDWIDVIDQFRWSAHVEIVAKLRR